MTTQVDTGLQQRFVELRFDGERTITGTLLRYDDVAVFPWGDRERFEPGAFGDVRSLDVHLDVQHDRMAQIARTGGGGLALSDSPIALELRAELDEEDPDAKRALRKVKNKILRGLSIEFMPIKHRLELDKDGNFTIIHEKAELRGAGVVDRPQYKQSVLRAQIETLRGGNDVDKDEVQKMIDESRAKEQAAPDIAGAVGAAVVEAMKRFTEEDLPKALDAEFQKRDEARAQAQSTADAEAERKAKEANGGNDDEAQREGESDEDYKKRMGMDDKGKKPKMEEKDKAEEIEAQVRARADLIVQVNGLLPKEFDYTGKTRHEILVAAAGDEVQDAEKRSDEYLLAKVEDIIERRSNATKNGQGTGTGTGNQVQNGTEPISVHRVFMERRRAVAVGQQQEGK